MINIENTEVNGWEAAIRGMRNPMNSWEKSDSWFDFEGYYESAGDRDCGFETISGRNILGKDSDGWSCFESCPFEGYESNDMLLGLNDHKLMMQLAKAGTEHSKYRRFITVTADITAPLYWWKEYDTYKVGTVANSCSTMHKIHAKEFTLEDFSCEHLLSNGVIVEPRTANIWDGYGCLLHTINVLNYFRENYLVHKDKRYWWQMIQLLPTSYNQRRTVLLNYENLAAIYRQRKDHKLDEWHAFCDWIESLPYSEIITLKED